MYSVSGSTPEHPLVKQVANRRLRWLWCLFFGHAERLHYVLGGRLATRVLAALLSLLRNRKIVIRIGGESIQKTGVMNGLLSRLLTRFAIRQADAVVGVNTAICDLAIRLGASAARVHHIPGFIAPVDDGSSPPSELQSFAGLHSPLFLASCQMVTSDGDDIYGVRLLLDMMSILTTKLPKAGLILWAYDARSHHMNSLPSLRADLKKRSLESQVVVHRGTEQLWPTMKICDVFLRPSTTDGDSNAIREAVFLGKPVVASDCVARPQQVLTFPTGDVHQLVKAAMNAAARANNDCSAATAGSLDNGKKLVSLFRQLLEK
jgi:glycosyltransferase involved in cell wall biosynthesis